MKNALRTGCFAFALVALAQGSAHAVWNGVVNTPLGQPEGTNNVFIELPDEPPQQAVDEATCNEQAAQTGEVCPPGYDWYLNADYKWKADLSVRLEYRDYGDNIIGEADGVTGEDGNLGQWNSYSIQTEFGTIRVGDKYQGQNGSQPSNINDPSLAKGADSNLRSDSWSQGNGYGVKPSQVLDAFHDLVPDSLRWTDITSSFGQVLTSGTSDRPINRADGSGKSPLNAYVDNQFRVQLRVDPDGWLGNDWGLDDAEDTNAIINPLINRPRFEIGLKYDLNRFDMWNGGGLQLQSYYDIPEDAGGGFIGSFTPGMPEQDYQGIDIRSRYQINDSFTLSGDYTFTDPQTGSGTDVAPDTSLDDFAGTLGGPIFKDKIWFFVANDCDKVLETAGHSRAPTMHMRITPPTAESFVDDPDTMRSLWHKDYDGALPVIVAADAGKSAIVAAIERLVNAKYSWFVSGEAAMKIGADSTVGQGGTGTSGGSGAPEIAIGDDDCDRTTTVIVPGQGPAVATAPPGTVSSTTRDPEEPCDCAKEEADVAEGRAWLAQIEQQFADAVAAYTALQGPMAESQREMDRIVNARDRAIERGDDAGRDAGNDAYYDHLGGYNDLRNQVRAAEEAIEEAAQARAAAVEALQEAEQALAACRVECPGGSTTAGGTPPAVPTGPQGPATTTGQPDEPCDCAAEQQALEAAQRALRRAENQNRIARTGELEAHDHYQNMVARTRDPARARTAAQDRQNVSSALEVWQQAMQRSGEAKAALEAAQQALQQAEAALAACQARCGQGSGTGSGAPAGTSGPQGPSTTTNGDGKQQPCDCSEQERRYQNAAQARADAQRMLREAEQSIDDLNSQKARLERERANQDAQAERWQQRIREHRASNNPNADQAIAGYEGRLAMLSDAIAATQVQLDDVNQQLSDQQQNAQFLRNTAEERTRAAQAAKRALDACQEGCR